MKTASKKKIVLIIFGAIALVTLCGFSLGEFDYYFSDPWSDNDERIHRDVKKYLKRKYNEEFIVNGISNYPVLMYSFYTVSASPKDNPDLDFDVCKGLRGKPYDGYLEMLLKPQVEERFVEITGKYFDDYKYNLVLSPTVDVDGNFMKGYGKDITFQDVIDSRTRLYLFDLVRVYVNEEYCEQKLSDYFKELFYRCDNPTLSIYYFTPEYYDKLALGTEKYDNPYIYKFEDHWYTVLKDISVTWEDYLKILEEGEYYDYTKRQDE